MCCMNSNKMFEKILKTGKMKRREISLLSDIDPIKISQTNVVYGTTAGTQALIQRMARAIRWQQKTHDFSHQRTVTQIYSISWPDLLDQIGLRDYVSNTLHFEIISFFSMIDLMADRPVTQDKGQGKKLYDTSREMHKKTL